MAIDSAVRRFSTMHVFTGGWVLPGATFDTDDRRDVIGDYRGIASGSVAPPVVEGAGSIRYLFYELSRDIDLGLQFVGLHGAAMKGAT